MGVSSVPNRVQSPIVQFIDLQFIEVHLQGSLTEATEGNSDFARILMYTFKCYNFQGIFVHLSERK
jgi:hypothetical protein